MAGKKSGKAYYLRQNLKVFALYIEPTVYDTLKRFAVDDDRSLQKTLNRIIAAYIRERLTKELPKKDL
jgi:hypothetical protein